LRFETISTGRITPKYRTVREEWKNVRTAEQNTACMTRARDYYNDLKNEIKIVQTISKDINMNFGLEKCARICSRRGKVQSKMHI